GRLVIELYQLAVAEVALGAGERRHFGRLREQADVVGNDARGAHARPEALDAAGVALVARERRLSSESLRRILRVGRVEARQPALVAVVDGSRVGLVGTDADRASQYSRRTRAGGIGGAPRYVRSRPAGRIAIDDAWEPVGAVVVGGLQLVPVVHAVIALELRIVRDRVRRRAAVVVHVQVHRL